MLMRVAKRLMAIEPLKLAVVRGQHGRGGGVAKRLMAIEPLKRCSICSIVAASAGCKEAYGD